MDIFSRFKKTMQITKSPKSETISSTPAVNGHSENLAEYATKSATSVLDPNFDKSKICQVKLDLNKIGQENKLAFLLENVFTVEECEELIKVSEAKGYKTALLNVGGGQQIHAPGIRDSQRCIIDDKEFARILFERISEFIPQKFNGKELVEINERLRFLRYDPGNQFKVHMDGSFMRRDASAESLITLQMYLNGGFQGGETTFFESPSQESKSLPVVPKPGMILVFEHKMLHEGSLLKAGRKYTIRTDVMYTK